ncbi:MAG TPA: putative inorganic carbon transporter subunit DabA, partial [Planctomycetaceae bacterium]
MPSTTAAPAPPYREGPFPSDGGEVRFARLAQVIEHAAHLLPAQGPITVFIHHNTLHAFEELPFEEAVKQGGKTFGCQPYLSEDRYREALACGRILPSDLEAVLREDL